MTQPSLFLQDNRLKVELGSRTYEIQTVTRATPAFGAFAWRGLNRTWSAASCRMAMIVTDANLAERGIPGPYHAAVAEHGIPTEIVVVPAGEESKSLEQAARLYDMLAEREADRHTMIIALGGGVVGDLAGFVAATYARGLPLVMVPTTLLAQVDSSVGGKVAVNHPRGKNLIGAFYQPIGVWIDTETLTTLPDRELRAGMAEVVKYALIESEPFLAYLEEHAADLLDRHWESIQRVTLHCCGIKAGIVARDEREEGGERARLNFGHTVAHAIEAVAGYDGPYRHGEAVAIGMVAESRLAERLGWIGADLVERVIRLLTQLGLPTSAPELDTDQLIRAMARDKKNRDGKIRFILPRSIGMTELTDLPEEHDVRAVFTAL